MLSGREQKLAVRIHDRLRRRPGLRYNLLLAGAFILYLLLLAMAAPLQAQDIATNTPDAEGLIYVEVQPNDSLWNIAAQAGLTIPQLLELNDLDESVVIQPGDRLIVGRGDPPATATSNIPTPTLPPPSVTPTPVRQRTAICISAYDDLNRNGKFEDGEPLRANVAFTVYNEQEVIANYITDGVAEPHCLEDLSPGVYHVTRSLVQNETLTTEGDWALTLSSGSILNLAFGSYTGDQQAFEPTLDQDQQLRTRLALTPESTPTAVVREGDGIGPFYSVMVGLAIVGFALLLGLAVLTFVFARKRRRVDE